MARFKDSPEQYLPLRPVEFEILLTLAAGEGHGYGILRATEERTRSRLETGTMYRALRRLVEAGLVEPTERRSPDDFDDERRRYYAMTSRGRAVASAEAARLARLVDTARLVHLLPAVE